MGNKSHAFPFLITIRYKEITLYNLSVNWRNLIIGEISKNVATNLFVKPILWVKKSMLLKGKRLGLVMICFKSQEFTIFSDCCIRLSRTNRQIGVSFTEDRQLIKRLVFAKAPILSIAMKNSLKKRGWIPWQSKMPQYSH